MLSYQESYHGINDSVMLVHVVNWPFLHGWHKKKKVPNIGDFTH